MISPLFLKPQPGCSDDPEVSFSETGQQQVLAIRREATNADNDQASLTDIDDGPGERLNFNWPGQSVEDDCRGRASVGMIVNAPGKPEFTKPRATPQENR